MTITERLRAVLCDPEGEPCFQGSDADRSEAKLALADLESVEAALTFLYGEWQRVRGTKFQIVDDALAKVKA